MATGQRTVYDLMAEHPEQTRVKLGPVQLRMNPQNYEQTTERAVVVVQTAGGYGRYDYGPRPREYVLSGSTGLAGVNGAGGVDDLRRFEPQPGQPDTLWPLEFPGEFSGRRWVKVTSFKLTRSSSSQYYHDYEIRVQEFPRERLTCAVTVPGSVLPSPLPSSG